MAYDYRVWRWIPQSGMVEHIEWLTDVIESQNGNEQRIRLRQAPRHIYEATVYITSIVEFSKIRVLLASWHNKVWGWPCWHEAVTLGQNLDAHSYGIAEDLIYDYGDFRPEGGLVFLYSGPSQCEVVDAHIDEEDGRLYFSGYNEYSHPAGSLVMPLRMARLSTRVERKDYTVGGSKISLVVRIMDNAILDYPYEEQDQDCGGDDGYGGGGE